MLRSWLLLHNRLELFLTPVALATRHDCPDDPSSFVGKCDSGEFCRFARKQPANPGGILRRSVAGVPQNGDGASHQ